MLTDQDLLDVLKKRILVKCRMNEISAKNCKVISQHIFEQDANYISESTIRRFYGIIEGNHSFSPFVLNSLSYFADSVTYKKFVELYGNSTINISDSPPPDIHN